MSAALGSATKPDSPPSPDQVGPGGLGSLASTFGWALFLACSWTWCIGMWLPVIFHRDYGPWAFLAFALPNCLGAAAMGLFLARRGQSESMVAAHRPAMLAFSGVTVAFQWFFLIGVLVPQGFSPLGLWLIALALVVRATGAVTLKRGTLPVGLLSAGVYMLSIGMLVWWLADGAANPISKNVLAGADSMRLPPIAAVCLFGFALCPYLDLTFHRARQSLDTFQSRAAFGIGFLVLFALMIIFTRTYAPHVIQLATEKGYEISTYFAHAAVAVHIVVQLAFTIAAHDASIAAQPRSPLASRSEHLWRLGAGSAAPFGIIAALAVGHGGQELVYRLFMGFYGLIFPAYVWICMIRGGGRSAPDATGLRARSLSIFGLAVTAAAPAYAAGFVFGREYWLLPGLGVVLLAGWWAPRMGGAAGNETARAEGRE